MQHHGDEARVEQVQHRVLVAADVARDRQPLLRALEVERPVRQLAARVAQEIPRRVEEGVGHIRLAPPLFAAGRAGDEVPLGMAGQRRDARVIGTEVVDGRQHHRQVRFGHRHRAAVVAVDDRDRRPPIPLARDAPIVEAILHRLLPTAARREPRGDRRLGVHRRAPVKLARIHHPTVGINAGIRGLERRPGIVARAGDDADNRQRELGGERKVPLVVPGDRHDGARAVVHQHVVGDPHLDLRAGRRVQRSAAGEDPGLLLVADLPRHHILRRRLGPIRLDRAALRVGGECVDQRMLGSEHEEGRTEERVGARGVDGDPRARRIAGAEGDLGAVRAAEPVLLRHDRGVRPIHLGRIIEVVQQPLGVVGDPEVPLFQDALFHDGAATLAGPGNHLLVGEHRLAARAPVDRAVLLVGETLLVELQEDPLGPLVVGRLGGRQDVPPREHPPHPRQLAGEVGDVARNQLGRVHPNLDGEVLGMDPEGVEADRLEHLVALHPLEPAEDIGAREREEIPHVQPFGRRIGEHHQIVEGPLGAVEIRLIGALSRPPLTPLGLDRFGQVLVGLGHPGTFRGSGRARKANGGGEGGGDQ